MSIKAPSQYDCNNMEQGDLIVNISPPFFYKWYRKHYLTDKNKILVRKDWVTEDRIEYYQEDCTLFFSWELASNDKVEEIVPYSLGYKGKVLTRGRKRNKFKSIVVGLENVQLILHSGLMIIFPVQQLRASIEKVDSIRKATNMNKQIREAVKFGRYKGDYFKLKSLEFDIKEWEASYCMVCRKTP